MRDAEPGRFFFLHLQKTAGTSLLFQFRETFPPEAIYPNPLDGDSMAVGPQFSLPRLYEGWAARREQIRLVIGHFPLCAMEELDAHFTTFTMLREPVSRTLSFLRHHRHLHPVDRDRPLEEIYEDRFRFEALIRNHMTKMLGMEASEMTDGMLTPLRCTERHLERATLALEGFPVVGLQHRFGDFCDDVNARYGWSIQQGPPVNTSDPVPVSRAFRRRIEHDNALDVELFEYACRLVDRRRGGVPGRSGVWRRFSRRRVH